MKIVIFPFFHVELVRTTSIFLDNVNEKKFYFDHTNVGNFTENLTLITYISPPMPLGYIPAFIFLRKIFFVLFLSE